MLTAKDVAGDDDQRDRGQPEDRPAHRGSIAGGGAAIAHAECTHRQQRQQQQCARREGGEGFRQQADDRTEFLLVIDDRRRRPGHCCHQRTGPAEDRSDQQESARRLVLSHCILLGTWIPDGVFAALKAVMDRMGHSQISTTQRYLHSLPDSDDKALAAFSKVHRRLA